MAPTRCCASSPSARQRSASSQLRYRLLFDLDPLHRGLIQVERAGAIHTGVLSPEQPGLVVGVDEPGLPGRLRELRRRGRPAHRLRPRPHPVRAARCCCRRCCRRRPGSWQPVASLGEALREVVKLVTAFTIAHSITLGLAAAGVVTLPARLVESAIAASLVLAALNNLWPLITRRVWLVAFGFGLIHGFGFASVLGDLGLPRARAAAGAARLQPRRRGGPAAIVLAIMPAAFWLRQSWLYERVALQLGSLAIGALAALWLIERAFGIA